jgi:ABC-type xylose transport system permease subunit
MPAKNPILARVNGSLQQLLAFGSLILILVFFSVASPYFFTISNLTGILVAATVTGILALGTTFVIDWKMTSARPVCEPCWMRDRRRAFGAIGRT